VYSLLDMDSFYRIMGKRIGNEKRKRGNRSEEEKSIV
jgi:hypothetical protein